MPNNKSIVEFQEERNYTTWTVPGNTAFLDWLRKFTYFAVKYQALSYFSISQNPDSKLKARPHKQSNLQVSMNTNTMPRDSRPYEQSK
jgi:hypothetical protein